MIKETLPPRQRINADIDMTPLIDVVFQLLIFLMVSSHFTKPDQFVELPSGSAPAVKVDQKIEKHTLTITSENQLVLNGIEIQTEQFETILAEHFLENSSKRLEVRGDTTSHLGTFIDIIERAKLAGIESLSYHKKANEAE